MALVDLIASSGARNFETMRKGWLPTAQETNARKMAELGIQEKQQKVNYEPERLSNLRQKRKEESTAQEQATKLFDEKMKKYKTTEEADKKQTQLSYASRITRGAFNVMGDGKGIEQARTIFRNNLEGLLEVNDDKGDEQIKKLIDPNTPDEEAIKMLQNFNAVMPLAQEALDKQKIALSKSESGTLYERLKQKKLLGLIDDEDQKKLDKLSGETSSNQYERTLTFKEKKERKKGMNIMSKDYKTEYKPFIHTANQITKIESALKSGDNAVMDIQVTNMLTNIEGSGIKAKSMYDIHNAPLGNIMERIKDEVSRFVGGVKTDVQKNKIRSAVADLKKYNNLVLRDGKDKYRSMARKNKYDVGLTVPFESFEEVQKYYKSGFWSKEETVEYLKQNPRLLKK